MVKLTLEIYYMAMMGKLLQKIKDTLLGFVQVKQTQMDLQESELKSELGTLLGEIKFNYYMDDEGNGNFEAVSDIHDMSEDSATFLALLLISINNGGLESVIYEGINEWVGDNKKRKQFTILLASLLEKTEAYYQNQQEQLSEPSAVDPSRVFNFRGMYEQ